MINLLPPDEKRQLAASRTNSLLLRYNFFMIGILGFIGLAIGVTYVYLSSTQVTAEQQVVNNKNKVSNYNQVQEQEKAFKANLATAKKILDKEIVYTKAILTIARLLPDNVILQSLHLDPQVFGTETTLLLQAKSVDDAVSLKKTFENSEIFTNVHFQSIGTTTGSADHPVAITMNVTINKSVALNEAAK